MQTFEILTDRVPTKKNRQRIGVSKSTGRPLIYKPKVVKAFETDIREALLVQRGRRIEGPMEFSMTLVYGSGTEPDLDGTITTVLDALQDGGLFDNDREIMRIYDCEKRPSSGKEDPPRVIVTIGNYEE